MSVHVWKRRSENDYPKGPWAPKPPLFLISWKKNKSNFHRKLVRTSDSADQDEELSFTGLVPKMGGRACERMETVARAVRWGEREDRSSGRYSEGHRAYPDVLVVEEFLFGPALRSLRKNQLKVGNRCECGRGVGREREGPPGRGKEEEGGRKGL